MAFVWSPNKPDVIDRVPFFLWVLFHITMWSRKDAEKDVEMQGKSDMHSWVEAMVGLYKHAPCGRNDQPVRGHCLPLIPLFGQDSNNHTDLSSPGHLNKCPA